jgi:hypothetical protein
MSVYGAIREFVDGIEATAQTVEPRTSQGLRGSRVLPDSLFAVEGFARKQLILVYGPAVWFEHRKGFLGE